MAEAEDEAARGLAGLAAEDPGVLGADRAEREHVAQSPADALAQVAEPELAPEEPGRANPLRRQRAEAVLLKAGPTKITTSLLVRNGLTFVGQPVTCRRCLSSQ